MNIEKFNNSLGVPRELMPQINTDKIQDFLDWLPCDHTIAQVKVCVLKPTQTSYFVDKVDAKVAYFQENGCDIKPLIVSSDMYLLDGHHNYLGVIRVDGNTFVNVCIVALPMAALLLHARDYIYSYTQNWEELEMSTRLPVRHWEDKVV